MTIHALETYRQLAIQLFEKAGVHLKHTERAAIEIADLGLNRFEETGLAIITYVNTERVCAKELALLPHQTCPEHRHPPTSMGPGKEETFRCRYGQVHLFVPGPKTPQPGVTPPQGVYTVFHEIVLRPGDQYTLAPNTLHWFKAGPEGAVISEFSTTSTDELDQFSDPAIVRVPDHMSS